MVYREMAPPNQDGGEVSDFDTSLGRNVARYMYLDVTNSVNFINGIPDA